MMLIRDTRKGNADMRVIDIDPILAWANDPEVHEPYGVRGSELMRKLWDAPTIDAVEVVRGEWIWHEDEDICNCSECEFEIDATGCIEPMEYVGVFRYCPNCGARMFAKGTNVPNKKGADDE